MEFSTTNVKVAVLVWLTIQNAINTLLLRYSRSRSMPEIYYSSVAVMFMEIFKVAICGIMILWETKHIVAAASLVKEQVFKVPRDTMKVCIPAMLYIVQNNLFYLAASHLDAATFMVVAQLKIFAAAIFSIIMLNRTLSKTQWFSIALLFIGVSLVQFQQNQSAKNSGETSQNPIIGFAAACCACAISGFAGVFFEKVLKGSAPVSVWMRNVQMALFAFPASVIAAVVQDGSDLAQRGVLYGFDEIVWLTVVWYGIGGLSVAVCIKYADNITKDFATSVAIVLATLGSVVLFNFALSSLFVLGASLVVFSIFLYSQSDNLIQTVLKQSTDYEVLPSDDKN